MPLRSQGMGPWMCPSAVDVSQQISTTLPNKGLFTHYHVSLLTLSSQDPFPWSLFQIPPFWLPSTQNYLSSLEFSEILFSCGRTLVPWELKTTSEIILFWMLKNNVLSETGSHILSFFVQVIEITLSAEGYAYSHVFLLLLQSNLYSFLLNTEILCYPPVISLSKDFKQTNEQLAGPSRNLSPQPVSLQNMGFQLWEHVDDYSFIKLYDAWI